MKPIPTLLLSSNVHFQHNSNHVEIDRNRIEIPLSENPCSSVNVRRSVIVTYEIKKFHIVDIELDES